MRLSLKMKSVLLFSGDDNSDAYAATVLAESPLAYLRMDEGSGATALDFSGNGHNGAYTGVTWDGTAPPMGGQAPYFDGVNDYLDMYSAGFAAAFDMDEGCVLIWMKNDDWTNTPTDTALRIRRNAANEVKIFQGGVSGRVTYLHEGDNVVDSVTEDSFSGTAWISAMISWSVADDELIAYKNGVQVGITQTGLIASTGSGLSTTQTIIGAADTGPAGQWAGYLAHCAVWTTPATAPIIALGVAA